MVNMTSASKGKFPVMPVLLGVVVVLVFAAAGYLYYDTYVTPRCEACGMVITPMMSERIDVRTPDGVRHWACCPMCALMLSQKYAEIEYKTFCDSTNAPIDVKVKDGKLVSASPETVFVIVGKKISGKCMDNKIAADSAAADALLTKAPAGSPKMMIGMAVTMAADPATMPLKWAPSPWLMMGLVVVGLVVLVGTAIAWRKLK